VWLESYVPAGEVLSALTRSARPEIAAIGAVYVSEHEPSLTKAITIAEYEVEVEGGDALQASLRDSLVSVVAAGVLSVEHKGKTKVFELATALPKEPEVRSSRGRVVVTVTVRIGERGSLRPDALVNAALTHVADHGRVVSVTRTDLFVEDGGSVRRPL